MTKTRPTTAPTPAESGEYDWAHRATAEYARIYLNDSSPEHVSLERQRMFNVMVQFGPSPKQLTARELALTKERDELKADLEDERHRAIVLRDMLEAPAPAVAQGETPHEVACRLLNESDPNNVDKWREVNAVGAIITPLVKELNEAKAERDTRYQERNSWMTQAMELRQSVARLTQERDVAKAERQAALQVIPDLKKNLIEHDARLTAAESALVEARKDGERIEWIERNTYKGRGTIEFGITEDGNLGVWTLGDKFATGADSGIRAAIDAARNQQ